MLPIALNLLPQSLWNLKATYGMVPEKLCIHNTANDATAINESRFVRNNPASTSYHYAVDDMQAVQILPLDRNGWHAGDGSFGAGNRKSIGIEICYSLSGGERFERSQENAAELCARLMHEFGWGFDLGRITKHEDYSSKHCPHRTLDDYGWDYFLALVQSKYETLYAEELPMTQEEKKAFEALVKNVDALTKKNEALEKSIVTLANSAASASSVQTLATNHSKLASQVTQMAADIAPCITSVNWDAHVTDAMGGKEARAMIHALKANGDFNGKDEGHYALSEQMVRVMLIFYRILNRLGLYK